jgi:hypothetical protein
MTLNVRGLPDQVVRLAVLAVAGLGAFVILRESFIPETFGDLGHYRASAVADAASKEIRYAGSQACADCHEDQVKVKGRSDHRTLACEVCHGPAASHTQDPESLRPAVPRERGEACLYCHDYLSSRPTGFPQIIESQHNPLDPCISCHDPHDPTPPQTPGSCSACHAQIARMKSISHHGRLECRTCHETPDEHSESPRAHLPGKPTERSFCGGCHAKDAKGPAAAPRVEMDSHGNSYLCWQCHYPHYPES